MISNAFSGKLAKCIRCGHPNVRSITPQADKEPDPSGPGKSGKADNNRKYVAVRIDQTQFDGDPRDFLAAQIFRRHPVKLPNN